MKTNLSSQIKLDRVARRYYAPSNEIELAALTREIGRASCRERVFRAV